MVITIAVSATLVTMSKMMNYTVNRGQAVDISNAITVSQIAIDKVRDQKFPPTDEYGILDQDNSYYINNNTITLSNTVYTYTTEIVDNLDVITPAEYSTASGDLIQGNRNLLQVTVTVSKNGRPLLTTVTYKTRNGYY